MPHPNPTFKFTIPSIHDDTTLDCRLYLPQRYQQQQQISCATPPQSQPHSQSTSDPFFFSPPRNNSSSVIENGTKSPRAPLRGAVLAHPYAPLGGCYDDTVVISLTASLLKFGWVVTTFNFRGAGGGAGRTSWSGRGEVDDYVSVAGFLVGFLGRMKERQGGGGGGGGGISRGEGNADCLLLFGGYSYGSLIVSHLPPTERILEIFSDPDEGTAAAEIGLRVSNLVERTEQMMGPGSPKSLRKEDRERRGSQHHNLAVMGGEETPEGIRRKSGEHRRSLEAFSSRVRSLSRRRNDSEVSQKSDESKPRPVSSNEYSNAPATPKAHRFKTAYLLVSPLLPPLSTVLATSLHGRPRNTSRHSKDVLASNNGLALFGDNDFFTSARRLVPWAEKLGKESGGKFQFEVIETAGHFWREEGVLGRLRQRVESWVESLDS